MADKPILFSAPMIKAILREIKEPGTGKTQTRRVYKSIPASEPQQYSVGDRLWVRESWSGEHVFRNTRPVDREDHIADGTPYFRDAVWHWADGNPDWGDWESPRPSIHMPRWASRITLEVTEVRYQRLQDISAADAIAEGCKGFVSDDGEDGLSPQEEFQDLWDSLNGTPRKPGGPDISWEANPWVVAITFRPHFCNIDQMAVAA